MRALLSTRLFATGPLEAAHLRVARDHGFPDLELYAHPRHLDIFSLGEVNRVGRLLLRAGVSAGWLRIGASVLNQLTDDRKLHTFGEVIRGLDLEVVTADTQSWGVRQDGSFLDLDELRIRVQANGARLVLDLGRIDERIVRRIPPDLGLCWDVAGSTAHEDTAAEIREVDEMLEGISRGRLLGVRVAHLADGRREVPDVHEARLLDEVWRLRAPGTLIYDIDDPSGFGSQAAITDVLEALQNFHLGGKRRHPEDGGGLFWAGLSGG